jgi:hypothetical protein
MGSGDEEKWVKDNRVVGGMVLCSTILTMTVIMGVVWWITSLRKKKPASFNSLGEGETMHVHALTLTSLDFIQN